MHNHRTAATPRRVRHSLIAALLAGTLLAAACGGSDEASPGTTAVSTPETTAVTVESGTDDGPDFPDTPPFPAKGETDFPVRLDIAEVGEAAGPVENDSTTSLPNFAPASYSTPTGLAAPLKGSGPVKLTGSTKAGVHPISRTPTSQGSGGRTRDIYPKGGSADANPPDPGEPWGVVQNGDGSTDYYYRDGSHAHVGKDGSGFVENKGQGTYDYYPGDGTHSHIGPGGNYVEDEKGNREYVDEEGNTEIPAPEYPEDPIANSGEADPAQGEDPGDVGADEDGEPAGGDDESSDPSDGEDPGDVGEDDDSDFEEPGDEAEGPGGIGDGGTGVGGYEDGDASGAAGEPHYLTEDGADVTSQVLGEFTLTTGVEGQEVQARTEPWLDSTTAAAVTAYAFGIDEHEVVVHLDGTVLVDGEAVPEGTELQHGLSGDGGAVGIWRDEADGPARDVVVVWPDLSVARIGFHGGYLNLDLRWTNDTGERRGILGTDDGDPTNDRTASDGTVMADDPDGYDDDDEFVRSWGVTDSESLFDYADGESAATFARDDFPSESSEPDLEAGAAACADVPAGFARQSCTYDVGLTGDPDAFVEPYSEFGLGLLSDIIRRATLAEVRAAIAGWEEAYAGDGEAEAEDDEDDRPTGGIALTAEERDSATEVEPDAIVGSDLDGSASVVYAFTVDAPSTLAAFSQNLECPNEPYTEGSAGYAFFDADLEPLGGPRLACDDNPANADVPAGTYYVKLVGPGAVDISLQVADQ